MITGGGAGLSYSSSNGVAIIEAACSPAALIAFPIFLSLYLWPLFRQIDGHQQAAPLSLRRRYGTFLLDCMVLLGVITVPAALVALVIESFHTGDFAWRIARHTGSPADPAIMATLWITMALFVLLLALPVGLQKQSSGGLMTGAYVQTPKRSILKALGRVIFSAIVFMLAIISIPITWGRNDRCFWHDLVFNATPVRLRNPTHNALRYYRDALSMPHD